MTVCFCIRPSKAKVKSANEKIMRKLSLNATRYQNLNKETQLVEFQERENKIKEEILRRRTVIVGQELRNHLIRIPLKVRTKGSEAFLHESILDATKPQVQSRLQSDASAPRLTVTDWARMKNTK